MADLSQTAANVVSYTPSSIKQYTSNGAVTAGQPVYQDANGNYGPAGAGGNNVISGLNGVGVALNSAPGAGQPLTVWVGGTVNLGATLAIGTVYVVSANNGKICPNTDLVTNNYVTVLGVAINAAAIQSGPNSAAPFATNTQHA